MVVEVPQGRVGTEAGSPSSRLPQRPGTGLPDRPVAVLLNRRDPLEFPLPCQGVSMTLDAFDKEADR